MDHDLARRLEGQLRGKTIGGWTVGDLLGNGKSAAVFAATNGDRSAALKVFDRDLVRRYGADVQRVRIQRELALVGHSHPFLVQIYSAGEDSDLDLFYVAMERLPDRNLAQALADLPDSSIPIVLGRIASAARFLLEERNTAHRDIKPENISVAADLTEVKLLDLGVLRPIDGYESITDQGDQKIFVGTLNYSPPELLDREEEDTPDSWKAITFYQLGAVLYDMIERRSLFADVSPWSRIVDAVRTQRPTFHRTGTSPHYRALALECLAKDPKVRLAHVSWDRFAQLGSPLPAQTGRDRLSARRAGAMSNSPPRSDGIRNSAQMLHTLAICVDGVFHRLRQTDLFPPLRMRTTSASAEWRAWIEWDGMMVIDLNCIIELQLCALVTSEGDGMLRLTGGARIYASENHSDRDADLPTDIYAGVMESVIIETRLEELAYNLLEKAHDVSPALAGNDAREIGLEDAWMRPGG
jgi:serine/threonine protein kinase